MGQWCSTCVHISFLFHTSRMAWNNFPSISEFFFFMFQIMIIPTLEELLCNERTLYKRLVFSLWLLSHYPEAFSEDTEHCAHQALPLPKHLTFSHTALLFVPSTLIVHPPALPSHFCSCGHFPGTPFVLSPNLLNPHPLLKYSFLKQRIYFSLSFSLTCFGHNIDILEVCRIQCFNEIIVF